MSTWNPKANVIFGEAITIDSPEQRAAFLDVACGADAELHERVERLITAHERAGSFLGAPAIEREVTLDVARLTEGPGTVIGRFKLLEQIGEGGFGVVYMAQQREPVRRRVALKVIKLGMDTKEVVGRFEAERQALAMMDHPHIAKVLDGGATETGRPYFVMELVRGIPINEFCDENMFTPRLRLKLFMDVCRAIQHAHQKGIIHRDIKPTNVLVTLHDGVPVPKVIDFGVAKATQQELTERTVFTRFRQFIGTPAYTSPEQAEMSGLDIDTRSDIYSLGALLYELLTGQTPFDAKELRCAGYDEMRRIIHEQEPPKPSSRVSTLADEALTTVASQRKCEPIKLSQLIRGELDWIVMKALHKDRTRRYQTAAQLADDVAHHLSDEPVMAGPPSVWYRLRKVVYKHRIPAVTGVAILAALVIGLVVATSGFMRARRSQKVAEQETNRASRYADKLAVQSDELTLRAHRLTRRLYGSSIALAQNALEHHDVDQTRQLLDACPQELRGWEWDHLHWLSDRSKNTIRDDKGLVAFVACSPDGRTFASATRDSPTVKLWDAGTRELLWTGVAGEHEDWVLAVAYSPDSRRIVSGASRGCVRLWDVATGNRLESVRTGKVSIRSVDFSPKGGVIALGDRNGALALWEASCASELWRNNDVHSGTIYSVYFSPDGKCIVTAGDTTVKLWDADTGRLVRLFADPNLTKEHGNVSHTDIVDCAAFSPDGTKIVSGADDATLKLWDVATGQLLQTGHGHRDWIRWLAFSPDGRHVASVSRDTTLRVWHSDTLTEQVTLHGHTDYAYCVDYSPDGRTIITNGSASGDDHTVKLWDADLRPAQMTLTGHGSWTKRFPREDAANSVAASPDGRTLVSGHDGGLVKLWDVRTGEELMNLDSENEDVSSVALSPDGRHLVSGGSEGILMVREAPFGEALYTCHAHGDCPILSLAISYDGRWIVSAGADKTIKLWEIEKSRHELSLEGHTDEVSCVAFSLDGRFIVSGSVDRTVRVWDAKNGLELTKFVGHEAAVRCIAITPDAKRIVSAGDDDLIRVWDRETGRTVQTLRGHSGTVGGVALSPDGTRIVSGSDDGTVKLWALYAEQPILTFRPHESYGLHLHGREVHSVAFSPDGKTILAGMADGSIRQWENAPPVDGYSRRQMVCLARQLVDGLAQEDKLYNEVVAQLEENGHDDDPEILAIGLRIAKARRINDLFVLRTQVRYAIWDPEDVAKAARLASGEVYRLALQKAEKAQQWHPGNRGMLRTLGVARYRAGELDRALETLSRCDQLQRAIWPDGHPVTVAVLAMTLYRLGRNADAQATMDRLERAMEHSIWADDNTAKCAVREAKEFVAGETK